MKKHQVHLSLTLSLDEMPSDVELNNLVATLNDRIERLRADGALSPSMSGFADVEDIEDEPTLLSTEVAQKPTHVAFNLNGGGYNLTVEILENLFKIAPPEHVCHEVKSSKGVSTIGYDCTRVFAHAIPRHDPFLIKAIGMSQAYSDTNSDGHHLSVVAIQNNGYAIEDNYSGLESVTFVPDEYKTL
ncbi:hypothetical protein [Vibrio alginolyticus]|uniref:hypothetical protein n=1 Tax=Vibrio alginolyticus TaxID=663 RepID=UPI0006CA8A83|nr:hypothetical protein [Vibrio alginolyticus]KPM97489.1 hypothetical protein AOG25_13535 [Vibrio alginolyticus]CAH7189196.1 conserved hypothetical protein [Vibrio chagasii]CAH7357848.1 conserved hypothetical protein [Vibrio chagasii]